MADTKISALPAASVAALANEFAINEAGTSKKVTGTQIRDLIGVKLLTGTTGTVAARAAPSETLHVLTSSPGDITGTALVTQITTDTFATGWWLAEAFIHWQSNVTSTGIQFVFDFSGTATPFMFTREDMVSSATALATVGVADQDSGTGSSNVGWLPSNWSVRADAGVLGPNAGVDNINVPQFSRISGLFLVTVSGNMAFRASAEVAATVVRVSAGTVIRYTRLS